MQDLQASPSLFSQPTVTSAFHCSDSEEEETPTQIISSSVPETPLNLQGKQRKAKFKRTYSQFFQEQKEQLWNVCFKCHDRIDWEKDRREKKKCNLCDKAVCPRCLTAERLNRRDCLDGFYRSLGVDYCDECLQYMICQHKKNRREADKLRKFRRLCTYSSVKGSVPHVRKNCFEEDL